MTGETEHPKSTIIGWSSRLLCHNNCVAHAIPALYSFFLFFSQKDCNIRIQEAMVIPKEVLVEPGEVAVIQNKMS